MIPEAPFLFSIAALSASLYGLAGLVAALRRGEGLRAVDLFRLRQIVEFAFANALFAVSVIPVAALTGDVPLAVQALAVMAGAYLLGNVLLLYLRLRRAGLSMTGGWRAVATALDVAALGAVAFAVALGSIAAYEVLLIVFLARPMAAFLFVLTTFEAPEG